MAVTTNYTGISYIEEVEEGVTPPTPEFQTLPTTGGSPVSNITTAVSEVIRADRQTDDLVVVDSEVTGEINYELSYEPYKPFLIALLQNDTIESRSFSSGAYDSLDRSTISGTGIESEFSIGDVFNISSITDDTINGFHTCIGNSVAGEIAIYPAVDEDVVSLSDAVLTTTQVITNGADKAKTYTFKKIAINDTETNYWYYNGIKISTMNWNFATGSILNGSFGVVGLEEIATDTPLAGQQPDLEVPPYSIMNSVSSVGAIYVEGAELGKCSFNSLDLTYDNQIESAKSIGVLGACETASYSIQITGSVELYFKDLSLYTKFLNAEEFGLTIILEDKDGNGIGMNVPKCKFESLDTPISGKDQFLMQSGSIRGLRDDTEGYMFKLSLIDAA